MKIGARGSLTISGGIVVSGTDGPGVTGTVGQRVVGQHGIGHPLFAQGTEVDALCSAGGLGGKS
jgi:hypothetical protein